MANSTTAWRRWSASNSTAVPGRSVTKAWWRQSGHRVAWGPTSRMRRVISRRPAGPDRVVSATCAVPPRGRRSRSRRGRGWRRSGGDRCGVTHGDRVAQPVAAAGGQDLGRPEPRVGAHGGGAACAGPADATGGLVDEPLSPAGGVGGAFAHAQVQHLAGVGAGGQQRMVAQHPGVAVGRAALGVPVDLAHRGVDIDGDRLVAEAGPGRPRPGEQGLGHAVELAEVAEGKRTQERAQGRGGPSPGGRGPGRWHQCAAHQCRRCNRRRRSSPGPG